MTEEKDIWDELLSLCDDADLNAWATATYWGDVRPKLKEGLEKLKERYDIYVKQFRNMTDHAVEQQKKLEAVKNWYDEHHKYKEVYDVNWDRLKKILEAEG